jgi:electron transfer flavoprotein alpha subunit
VDRLCGVKIVVLVKQIPNPSHVTLDPETRRLVREGVPLELNEFDVYAVTAAIGLREAHGGEVVTMTMGPPQAEEALRTTLAMGADRATHLSDRIFAVADTLGTSRTLALAVEKEGADLVLCGRKTLDSETWQVPAETAAFLGWPQLTNVDRLDLADGILRVRRETDDGYDTYELELPAVVSVTEGVNEGIWPARRDVEATATEGRITVWQATDLVDEVGEYDLRFGQTGSPTRVLAVKDVTPERGGEIASSPQQAAERVLELLAEVGGPPTSPWEKPERLGQEPGERYDCWSVVELLDGRPRKVSLELLGKGRELAGKLGGESCALVLGDHGAATELARWGAERIVVLPVPGDYLPDVYARALRAFVEEVEPHALLIPSTASGRDYGPRVAGELELGMTGDCVDLGIDRAGRLIQYKPAFGGNIVSVIMGATTPQLATVRPGMFSPVEPREDAVAEVTRAEPVDQGSALRLVEQEHRPDTAGWELDSAAVCLCVGKGVGGPEAIPEIEAYAARLGAAVGASRDVADAGWLPKNRQIGLTGRAIAPRLQVEIGVRGAFEHIVGSVKAGVIVALNANERAPVFAHADVGLVGDWRELLPPFVDALEGSLP